MRASADGASQDEVICVLEGIRLQEADAHRLAAMHPGLPGLRALPFAVAQRFGDGREPGGGTVV
jgi:hypothetical protein